MKSSIHGRNIAYIMLHILQASNPHQGREWVRQASECSYAPLHWFGGFVQWAYISWFSVGLVTVCRLAPPTWSSFLSIVLSSSSSGPIWREGKDVERLSRCVPSTFFFLLYFCSFSILFPAQSHGSLINPPSSDLIIRRLASERNRSFSRCDLFSSFLSFFFSLIHQRSTHGEWNALINGGYGSLVVFSAESQPRWLLQSC